MKAIIVNPNSSRSKGGTTWMEIREEVLSRLGGAQEFVTQKSGDATRFAREIAVGSFEMVVVVGGDGTINEVVNGLYNEAGELLNPKIILGLMSVGRGCDLRRSLGAPSNYRDAVGVLLNPKIKKMDIGRAIYVDQFGRQKISFFANSFSAGISGDVIRNVNAASGLLPPELTYFGFSALEFLSSRGHIMELTIDGKKVFEGRALNIFVSNGKFCGAGMKWAPEAELDDGLLNIIVLEPIPKYQLLLSGHKLYKGTMNTLPGVKEYTGKDILINASVPVLIETDGEQPGLLPAHVGFAKHPLQVAT